MTDEVLAHELIDDFIAAGGNFIDTAEMYPIPPSPEHVGATEKLLGRWIAAHPEQRKKVVIASKVCGPFGGRFFVYNNRPEVEGVALDKTKLPNHDRANILTACEGILQRLQTDYLDILYLHWPSRPVPMFGRSVYTAAMKDKHPLTGDALHIPTALEESITALGELIRAGKIRHWAISNETSFGVCTIAALCKQLGVPKPVCIQNDFSLLDRRFHYELAEACAPWNHNISGCPYGVLAGGTLSGKYLDPANPPIGARHLWKPEFQARYHSPAAQAATANYAALAKTKGLSPTVLALAWAKQCFFNRSLIIGVNNKAQLAECLSVVDVTLDAETLEAIDSIHAENKNPNLTS
eukprot:GGOE01040872.1.p1 GENE.GGOE01040872.1~~GGOE01040872.1.p1  ORF type:complete len:388 (-),score=110.09 GGOE01040872.1:298-1353(-)